jgi:hypothetical protein
MKKLIVALLLWIPFLSKGQVTYTQTFIDKCNGQVKIATTTYVNGNAVVSFYDQIKTFTPAQVQNGTLQTWLQSVYDSYNSKACPVSTVVQQTIQTTVSQASTTAAAAASNAASSAASKAASSSAAASSTPAASSSSSNSTSSSQSSGGDQSSSNTSSSSTQSSGNESTSSSTSSSSSSSSSDSKSTTSSSSESKSSDSKSSSSESKSDSKSDSKKSNEEKKKEEEKKKQEEKKKKEEERKKRALMNPTIIASDLTGTESTDKHYSAIFGLGWSRSSFMGDKTFSLNAMVWSTLNQFALSGGYTKMNFENGKISSINSYGLTVAYLNGNMMALAGYTWIKPDPKIGTYGYNIGVVNLFIPNSAKTGYDVNMISSEVFFWTKTYKYNKKITLSPQAFFMSSPLAYNSMTGATAINRQFGVLTGVSMDYKLSKRFGLSLNYKLNMNTQPGVPFTNNFLLGSRMML